MVWDKLVADEELPISSGKIKKKKNNESANLKKLFKWLSLYLVVMHM